MSTIPASQVVNVLPSVLNAGGNALELSGLFLTLSTRVPIGQVMSFSSPLSVGQFFGLTSHEYDLALVYFQGFDNSTQKPGAMLFAQYPANAVAAYLRGGNISSLTIPQLQAISGVLVIVVDGATRTAGALSLGSATSYSAAAALIQAALVATEPTEASVTGSIATGASSFTGSIAADVMTVTVLTSGTIPVGSVIAGTGVTAGTVVTQQLSGTGGGVGTYAVSPSQNVASSALTGAFGTMTVTAIGSGTLSVGQTLSGSGVTANTQITAPGTGSGLTGTYIVTPSQTATSTTIVAKATDLTVAYDSISGAFVITSGITGTPSTIAFASGSAAAPLLLTQATGATLSQGAAEATPSLFMTGVTQVTQNWATFMTTFDPDAGAGSAQKQLFAAWVNSTNDRYAYICWDTDVTPTLSVPASSSMGHILQQSNSSGTCMVYEPSDLHHAAFVCGTAASIDFNTVNGRITFAFRKQTGLVAGVTSGQIATNLAGNPQTAGDYGNGYNFYGAYATANEEFVFFNRGTVSGPFIWLDSYINQIWLNNSFQLALIQLLQNVNSIPYNRAGYDLIAAACQDTINAGLLFGAFRPGVTLSQAQIAEVNNAAGVKISDVLQQRGWFLQITDAAPIVRQGRASPPCKFWYMDGEAVQAITLNSILVQ